MLTKTNLRECLNREQPRLFAVKHGWLYLIVAGVCIALLINHQQPYGLHSWHHPHKWLIISCFGLIGSLLYAGFYGLLPRVFTRYFGAANWTLKKQIVTLAVFFVVAGMANWVFALLELSYYRVSVGSLLRMELYTLETGILPVVFLSLLADRRDLYRKNREQKAAMANRPSDEPVIFKLGRHTFDLNNVVYISKCVNSLQFHILEHGKCRTENCTGTMKMLVELLKPYPFMRQTHESFVVNMHHVHSTTGNSNGKKIRFKYIKDIVTVSRGKYYELIAN